MNLRLVSSRVLVVLAVGLTVVSTHPWAERSAAAISMSVAGYVLLLGGAVGRIWCAAHVAGRKNKDLVVEGPYSVSRNPLYFFSFLALIGAGLSFESLVLTAVFIAVFFATHWPTILREESFLAGEFGDSYRDYARRVPRFLPRPSAFVRAGEVTINTRAFTRAMVEAGLIPLVYLAAKAVEEGHRAELLPSLLQLY